MVSLLVLSRIKGVMFLRNKGVAFEEDQNGWCLLLLRRI